MKKRIITGLALWAKGFNTRHRKLIPVTTFFVLIIMFIISFFGNIFGGIANIFKAVGKILAYSKCLIFGTKYFYTPKQKRLGFH